MSRRSLILLVFALLFVRADAQDSLTWQVTTAEPLALQSGVGMRMFPAPDSQHIAYERTVRLNGHRDLFFCAADITSNQEPLCLEPPQELPRGFDPDARSHFFPAAWSSDSAKIAVVGQPLVTSYDTDVWIVDLRDDSWTNLTDDGYDGPLAETEDSAGPPAGVSIEVQPAWSPDGAQIAVERTLTGEDGAFLSSTLSLIDMTTGDIQDIAMLPGHATHDRDAGSVTGIAWSPDGTRLAVSLRHREPDPENDGIWLVDVASGDLEPVLGFAQAEELFASIFPDVALETIGPVFWSPDGRALLFWASNPTTTPVALWAFWIDLESGEATALPLPSHPRDTGARRGIWPLEAVWSPTGDALLVAANGLHPDDEQILLDPENRRVRMSVYLVDAASAESALLGHLPPGEAAPFYLASWSADGDVILNGYHLVMEQE